MSTAPIMYYYGWIAGEDTEENRRLLSELHIVYSNYNESLAAFTGCIVPPLALQRLEREWMSRFVWSLS